MWVPLPRGLTPQSFLFGLTVASGLIGCKAVAPGRTGSSAALAQEELPSPTPVQTRAAATPTLVKPADAAPGDKPLPINLPTALQLTNARAVDVAIASERIRVAAAQLNRANVLWLPTLYNGADYTRHDGQIQSPQGDVIGASRSSVLFGSGPFAVFAITDAIFSPLAERQVVRARQAGLQAATNDTTLAVAEAYFNVQQARGESAGAEDALLRTQDLVERTEELASGLALPVEVSRARTELSRRRQAVYSARALAHGQRRTGASAATRPVRPRATA